MLSCDYTQLLLMCIAHGIESQVALWVSMDVGLVCMAWVGHNLFKKFISIFWHSNSQLSLVVKD